MNRSKFSWWICMTLPLILAQGALALGEDPPNAEAARKLFASPPREYATAPLWVWNDMLTEEQIRGTMQDLAGQKVMQVFVHPRPGLMTPYLSDEWFRLWKIALDEAEKLDMNVWIYDENSYPSGFAGGHVPEIMPESRGRGLAFREETKAPQVDDSVVAVYQLSADKLENVTQKLRDGETLPDGRYAVASVVRATNSPWHGDRCYVDLMYPGVTEKFLEVTLDAYKKNIGDQFGKRVLGAFTDEPNVRPADGLPWTDHLPKAFQERWGYDLIDHLPSLIRPVGDWKQVRHDYYQVVLEQYIEHWAKPYYNWCEANGIGFTGHYWDHEWPNCQGVTDNMAMSAWQHYPGIDCLMNQYREDTHAQFGNVRFVKEVQSLCNQLGRKRYLCEIYGAGGWDLRFEDMKRIADWLGVLGVNLFDEHLSYVTLRGARKADHPQSFSYHEPWWDSYHVMAEYITRLSAAMSMGKQVNQVLVVEPTTTAWLYQVDPTQAGQLNQVGKTFFDLVLNLELAQAEYDIGCEDVMARHGKFVASGSENGGAPQLTVGERNYSTIVLPPLNETLRSETMKLLEEYAAAGGRIVSCGPPPTLVDGRPSDRGAKLSQAKGWVQIEPAELAAIVQPTLEQDQCVVRRSEGDQGKLFHQRRQLADGELLLLVNTSIEHPAVGTVETQSPGLEQWDLFSGKTRPVAYTSQNGVTTLPFNVPPCGSLLLYLGKATAATSTTPAATRKEIAAKGPVKVNRLEPNVLTVDFVDVTAGGETLKNVYYYRANQFVWQKNGLPRDPWDSAVQYNDELISKTFPAESGFEVSYRFTIDGTPPKALFIVVERPDIYTITCNGKPLESSLDSWWLDKAFGKLDISKLVNTGENVVTLKAQPFTMFHEIASAFVLGDFSLQSTAAGYAIGPPKAPAITTGVAHGTDIEGIAWLSSGIGFQRDPAAKEGNDGAPTVAFDLGKEVELGAIEVWNYNEAAATERGVKKMEVCGSTVPEGSAAWQIPLGTFELARGAGGPIGQRTAFSEKLVPTAGKKVRYVKFTILANQQGVTYPTTDGKVGNAFVGLSEVKFHGAGANGKLTSIDGVKIHSVSSQLVVKNGFDRAAEHMVDGSGLGEAAVGWNQQGMPFYSGDVAYCQTFTVDQVGGTYKVCVPKWYGSVAKVSVNGKFCGPLVSQPWEVDVTDAMKKGENVVEVIVTGTLKNTLGPHHAGSGVGSAWPGMFQQGPEHQPPGSSYHTLGYGLFAPMTLECSGK